MKVIKKIIVVSLALLCTTGCAKKSEDNIDNEKIINIESDNTIPDEYKVVLDSLCDYIENGKENEVTEEMQYGLSTLIGNQPTSDDLRNISFSLMDIDENGVKELIIWSGNDTSHSIIIGLYSINNDKACIIAAGYARSRYYLLEDKTIYFEGSGGAADSYFGVYKLADDGISLVAVDYFFTDFIDEEHTALGLYYNKTGLKQKDKSEYINKNQIDDLKEKYRKNIISLETTSLKKYKNCRDDKKTSSNNTASKGVFYKNSIYDETTGENVECVSANTGLDQIVIFKPENAKEIDLSDKFYKYSISDEAITIDFTYEIRDDISSEIECEKYIDSITSELPLTIKEDSEFSVEDWTSMVLGSFPTYINATNSGINSLQDIRDVWTDYVGKEGVAYFYESCDYSSVQPVTFNKIITQACNNHNGITVLETIEVTFCDYPGVLHSSIPDVQKRKITDQMIEIEKELKNDYCFVICDGKKIEGLDASCQYYLGDVIYEYTILKHE